jgi:Carboxypeptidase regulatory-like domain
MRTASSVASLTLAVTAALMFLGCDSAPSAPSEVGQSLPTQPVPPSPGLTRLTGSVVEPDGQGVPGAVVTWLYGGRPSTTVTAGTGAFELTLDTQPPEGIRLTVEKDGFEPSVVHLAAEGRTDLRRDVNLHRISRVAVGSSVRLSIGPSDSFCSASASDSQYDANARPCRRIRVVSASEGRLDMWVNGADVEPRYRIQLAAKPEDGLGSYFSTPVDAGSETVVDLVLIDTGGPFVAVLGTRLSGWWDY